MSENQGLELSSHSLLRASHQTRQAVVSENQGLKLSSHSLLRAGHQTGQAVVSETKANLQVNVYCAGLHVGIAVLRLVPKPVQ